MKICVAVIAIPIFTLIFSGLAIAESYGFDASTGVAEVYGTTYETATYTNEFTGDSYTYLSTGREDVNNYLGSFFEALVYFSDGGTRTEDLWVLNYLLDSIIDIYDTYPAQTVGAPIEVRGEPGPVNQGPEEPSCSPVNGGWSVWNACRGGNGVW